MLALHQVLIHLLIWLGTIMIQEASIVLGTSMTDFVLALSQQDFT
jgi:hypothetical protein